MPLSDSEVRSLEAGDKRKVVSAGDSLYIVVYPRQRGGGKYFVGRMRHPPGAGAKQVEVQIGPYGKGVGKWSLKKAREEWDRIRTWSRDTGNDPRDLKKAKKEEVEKKSQGPTFQQLVDAYLAWGATKQPKPMKPRTVQDYRNKLVNQMMPELGADTPVKQLSWDASGKDGRTGREVVLAAKQKITLRGKGSQSDKCLAVLKSCFDYGVSMGWMERNQNPAVPDRTTRAAPPSKSNPSLEWGQLPKFFEDLERNDANAALVVRLAVKVLVLTFLRVGSLTPARWEEFDLKKDLWTIPADRMKTGKAHQVPLTAPLKEVLKELRQLNGGNEYVFFSPRGREYQHVHKDSLNAHIKKMGYKGLTTAHGFRHLALTAGQEVLKVDHEIIQRQMAHTFGDKIRGSYDKSQMMEERRDFMVAWSDALLEQGLIT